MANNLFNLDGDTKTESETAGTHPSSVNPSTSTEPGATQTEGQEYPSYEGRQPVSENTEEKSEDGSEESTQEPLTSDPTTSSEDVEKPVASPVLTRKDAEKKVEESPDDYLYLRAWVRLTSSNPQEVERRVQYARDNDAPPDAVYQTTAEDGSGDMRWLTFDEIVIPDIKEQLRKIVSKENAPVS